MHKLIQQLEAATGPNRKLDLAISVATNFADVFEPAYEWKWGAGGDEIEGWKDGRRQACLDPWQFAPHWTANIDNAVRLVPDGWFWRVGRTSSFKAWAGVNSTHPDHGERGKNEFFWKREPWEPNTTPAIALCICALEARMVMQKTPARV